MEKRIIKNTNKEYLQDEVLSIVNDDMHMLFKNRKTNVNPLYDPVYDEKTQTITLKEVGKHIFNTFNDSDCKQLYDKKCECNHIYSCNGYYIFCTECGLRQPEEDKLFPLTENVREWFINYGIINNTININNNTLTKYDVMKNYPISMDLFKNKKHQELFIKILENHKYKDIVKYFEYNNTKYRYYKDKTIYNSDNELLSEIEFYDIFQTFICDELNRIIKFYGECKEYPIIDNICYNRHIIFNMNVLKEVLDDKKDNIIKYLLDIYNTKELSYINYTNKQFTDRIYYTESDKSIIKYSEIYKRYLEWRSIKQSTDILLSKEALKNKIIEHLNTKYPNEKDKLKYDRYRDGNNKGKENRFYGWLYIYYDNIF